MEGCSDGSAGPLRGTEERTFNESSALPLTMQLQQIISGESDDAAHEISPRPCHSATMSSDADLLSSSPSLPYTSTPKSSQPKQGSEKDIFLDDLSHFIPVGALRSYDGVFFAHRNGHCGSTEYPEDEVKRLEKGGWIRTSMLKNEIHPGWISIRVFVLPDDVGRKLVPRSSQSLRKSLKTVMSKLDVSVEAWAGRFDPGLPTVSTPEHEDESLFYIFNTLVSPDPNTVAASDPWSRRAMEELLCNHNDYCPRNNKKTGVSGLRTPLYGYQRRSAAFMLQKESEPGELLDPRLQSFRGPTAQQYYYDKEEGSLVREKRLYSNIPGGVLAETMGFGKTLICLALVLATRGHFPRVPAEYLEGIHPVRSKTASLAEMAAAAAGRFSVPWERYFSELESCSMYFGKCLTACEQNRGVYAVSQAPRYSRGTKNSNVKTAHIRICSGTLIVVPPNLVDHWLNQIEEHTYGLDVLVLRDSRTTVPPPGDLLKYDIVLISKTRFERESRDYTGDYPRLPYSTPLKELHWLRIIVDEGHNFASASQKSTAVHFLEKLRVERRWVVSGTPSSGLYGIEVSLASQETASATSGPDEEKASSILHVRKKANKGLDDELKNLDKLRRIIVDFLGLKPWSNSRAYDSANWTKYIKPVGLNGQRGISHSLRPTLQSIVVRHRAEHVDRELMLPKLHNKVVYLEPTFYDKLSLNLFIFHLTVNAVTSERTDEDYMFHPKNRKYLSELIRNMRHAGFWWTGFKSDEIEAALRVARKYKEEKGHRMSVSDCRLINTAIEIGEKTISCHSWRAFSTFDEMGIFVHDFPEHACNMWSIDGLKEHQQLLLLSIFQAKLAQRFVTSNLCSFDPAEGIAGAGIRAKRQMHDRTGNIGRAVENGTIGSKQTNGQPVRPAKSGPLPEDAKRSGANLKELSPDSPLARAKIVATTSAKLTYLLERVLEFQATEKIIIFYEHNNTAFWIAEALEMLGVEFRIYANTLKAELKSRWLRLFNGSETVRVLLMDLRQASHGLHVACASRVFIVNPIWDPNIESQAIKRAHRISQTRPVFVETLVLKDTLEDRMLCRRKEMTNAELQHAEKDLLDDQTMSRIIQAATFLPVSEDEASARPAYLNDAPGFFNRHKLPVPDDDPEPLPSPSSPDQFRFPQNFPPSPSPQSTSTPLSPSPSPEKHSSVKRKGKTDDTPWIYSDIRPSFHSNRGKKRRVSTNTEVVTETGIVLVGRGRNRSDGPFRLKNSRNESSDLGMSQPASTHGPSASGASAEDGHQTLPAGDSDRMNLFQSILS